MSGRPSQQDVDGTTWSVASIPLGTNGMDLRAPQDPGTLADLLNARFRNERTLRRRDGHHGVTVYDEDSWPGHDNYLETYVEAANLPPTILGLSSPVLSTSVGAGDWVYGHGHRLTGPIGDLWQNAHVPLVKHVSGLFTFGGEDIVWTGDRLLIVRDGQPSLGGSTYWDRDSLGTDPLPRGIPAFLPSMTDTLAPNGVSGDYLDTCVSTTQRFYVNAFGTLFASVLDRQSGALLNTTELDPDGVREPRVFMSGAVPVAIWRNINAGGLFASTWDGSAWTAPFTVSDDATSFDVAVVPNGFHVLYRTSTSTLKLTRFVGGSPSNTKYPLGATVTGATSAGPVAIAVAPDDSIGVAWYTSGSIKATHLKPDSTSDSPIDIVLTGTGGAGLTMTSRGLSDVIGNWEFVIYECTSATAGVQVVGFTGVNGGPNAITPVTTRFNATVASHAFTVDDEVFAWLREANIGTNFLLAGLRDPVVAGYADREEALTVTLLDGNTGLPGVTPDPLNKYAYTWVRKHNTALLYTHVGSVRTGDLDFLPRLTTAAYGRSTYLSGSAVKNFDGQGLADAGFQSYPKVTTSATTTSGSLAGNANDYQYRVYAVRYNQQGERFESAALTYSHPASTAHGIDVTIATIPDVSTDDVVFEVYRTIATGAAFYLEGIVVNVFTAATVVFHSTLSDTTLQTREGDPHAPAIGVLPTLETFGPIGCSILATVGDRLWGAGGQVPAGQVQFSTLKTENAAAGFDDLAGSMDVNGQGDAVTSIIGMNDAVIVFQRDRLFVLGGDGPDNFGNGGYNVPQLVLAAGASTHLGTVLTQLGILYWGIDGPLLLGHNFQVSNVSSPVRSLTTTLTPTGVQSDVHLMEVVWFTASGDAVLLNYMAGSPRWARWRLQPTAGVSDTALATTNGTVLLNTDDAGDGGIPFAFTVKSGLIRPEDVLQGHTLVRRAGITGEYNGPHDLRMSFAYNGAPLWNDRATWNPVDNTWLATGDDLGSLKPAAIDALGPLDKSGAYATARRTHRQDCRHLTMTVSDVSATGPTFTPYELTLELGSKPGVGRVPVGKFTDG